MVAKIPVRELRNDVSAVLRRVEAGESLEVTVHNRPVALLAPRAVRPHTVPADQFLDTTTQADPELRNELARVLTETTGDLADPWSQ